MYYLIYSLKALFNAVYAADCLWWLLSPLLEFNSHEKTHMHYHLRQAIDYHQKRFFFLWMLKHWPLCLFFSPGHKVVVVRCEGINISGNFYRNKRECILCDLLKFWFAAPCGWHACCPWWFPTVSYSSLTTMRLLYMHYHLRHERHVIGEMFSPSPAVMCGCNVPEMASVSCSSLQWSTWLSCARGWTPIPLVDRTTSELPAGSSGGPWEVRFVE